MSSTDEQMEKRYEDLTQTEIEQIEFMSRRLGFDHFVFAGYDSVEFQKHVLSRGWYEEGGPKVAVNASMAGAAYVIARILTDFPFSDELRRGVHSIINTVLTTREIEKNRGENDGRESS